MVLAHGPGQELYGSGVIAPFLAELLKSATKDKRIEQLNRVYRTAHVDFLVAQGVFERAPHVHQAVDWVSSVPCLSPRSTRLTRMNKGRSSMSRWTWGSRPRAHCLASSKSPSGVQILPPTTAPFGARHSSGSCTRSSLRQPQSSDPETSPSSSPCQRPTGRWRCAGGSRCAQCPLRQPDRAVKPRPTLACWTCTSGLLQVRARD